MTLPITDIDTLIAHLHKIRDWHGNVPVELTGDGFNVHGLTTDFSYFKKVLRFKPYIEKHISPSNRPKAA